MENTYRKNQYLSDGWDFRSSEERKLSSEFIIKGYTIAGGSWDDIERIRELVTEATINYFIDHDLAYFNNFDLGEIHKVISKEQSNNLRLYIMKVLLKSQAINYYYYSAARDIIHSLCGNELAMQKAIGLSINLPMNNNDVLPIHADTWNGVSPYELNIWLPLTNCRDSLCLYILEKEKYQEILKSTPHLLKKSSDEIFDLLKPDLTWITINYGDILAFDQSLPHGFSLNEETASHWSLNCRFKGLHTPYWDKRLGEYFMPITVKTCTQIGIQYTHPREWLGNA